MVEGTYSRFLCGAFVRGVATEGINAYVFRCGVMYVVYEDGTSMQRFGEAITARVLHVSVYVQLDFGLSAAYPIILYGNEVTFRGVAVDVGATVRFVVRFTSSHFKFRSTVPREDVFQDNQSQFVVIICRVRRDNVVTAIQETVCPIRRRVICGVRGAVPASKEVASQVAYPRIARGYAVLAAWDTTRYVVMDVRHFYQSDVLCNGVCNERFRVF